MGNKKHHQTIHTTAVYHKSQLYQTTTQTYTTVSPEAHQHVWSILCYLVRDLRTLGCVLDEARRSHDQNCVNHMRKVNSIAAHNPTSIFKFQATKRRAHTDKCCTIDDRRTHFLSHRLYHELVGIEAYGSCITRQVLEYWRTHTGKSTNHPTRCLIGTNIFRGAWQGP